MQAATVTKLNIIVLFANDNELLKISAKCQALTHFNIFNSKITMKKLLKIMQLKVVRSDLDGDYKRN